MANLSSFRLLAAAAVLATGCAHAPASSNLEEPKSAAEAFWMRARWKDFQGASEVLVPERRTGFLKARRGSKDEHDLSLTDYELLEAKVDKDGLHAQVVVRVSWIRLPSVSERTATVTSDLVKRRTTWLVAHQDEGPFAGELSAPYQDPAPAPAH